MRSSDKALDEDDRQERHLSYQKLFRAWKRVTRQADQHAEPDRLAGDPTWSPLQFAVTSLTNPYRHPHLGQGVTEGEEWCGGNPITGGTADDQQGSFRSLGITDKDDQ
jgi:hypothetical protein